MAILALAFMEEEGEALYWNFKIPLPSIIYTVVMQLFPYLYTRLRRIYIMMKGLWRQPSRRHGRHESSGMELSGLRREP